MRETQSYTPPRRPTMSERAAWFRANDTNVAQQVGSPRRSLIGSIRNGFFALRAIYRWLKEHR